MYFIQTSPWKRKLIVNSYTFSLFHPFFSFSRVLAFQNLNYLTVSFKLYDMDCTGFIERKEV
jgi:hypothetical protein